MKKIFSFLIGCTLIIIPLLTSAGSEVCPIENGTPELNKYLKEFRAQTNVTIKEIVKNPKYNPEVSEEEKEKLEKTPWFQNFLAESGEPFIEEGQEIKDKTENYLYGKGKKVIDVAKQITRIPPTWDSYILSSGFWIGAILYDYSLPIAIKRDFSLIRLETERLNIYIDNLVDSGIDINPEFENSYVLGLPGLLELNKRLEYAFMGSIIKGFSSKKEVLERANEAVSQLQNYINKNNLNFNTDFLYIYTEIIKLEQCRQGTGPIDQIIEVWENGFDGIFDEWKDSYDLLMGSTGLGTKEQERKAEKRQEEILRDLYGNNPGEDEDTDILFGNLGKDFELERLNPVSDSSEQEWEILKKYLEEFKQSVEDFGDKVYPNEQINIKDLNNKKKIEFDKIDSTIRIRNLYEELKYVIPATSKSQNDLKNQILENHKTLEDAIYYLDRASPIAEKVCNSQGVGMGKCKSEDYTK